MAIDVALARILEYESTLLPSVTALVLEESGFRVARGERVLVKPNLVASVNAKHCSTNALIVAAACAYLLDHGADVTVADSPAFGSAARVAQASGLAKALRGLGLTVRTLKNAQPLELSVGGCIGLSRDALEADRILNMPKLKVHCQMTMSAGVKNLFGCVVGFRKAVAHNRMGHSHEVFRSMLMDVHAALPQTHCLMDAVHPLHKDGPIKGEPFELGMLGASADGVAMDTAAYLTLGLMPDQIPLWDEAFARKLPGAAPSKLRYPLDAPTDFDAEGFEMSPVRELSFNPVRIVRGRIKSFMERFSKSC